MPYYKKEDVEEALRGAGDPENFDDVISYLRGGAVDEAADQEISFGKRHLDGPDLEDMPEVGKEDIEHIERRDGASAASMALITDLENLQEKEMEFSNDADTLWEALQAEWRKEQAPFGEDNEAGQFSQHDTQND